MSAFTFTAPIVTEEEEQAEKDALTEDERRRIENDLYGLVTDIIETEELLNNGLILIQEALDALPLSLKTDYMRACEISPELVEGESPFIRFLRVAEWDAWAAAERLVNYWKVRVKIFGSDRAFLPMTLDGALAEDVPYLEKAVVFRLPSDKWGRPILFFDRIRCVKEIAPRDSVIRCLWYVMQTMSNERQVQKKGYVAVSSMRGFDLYKHFDRILSKNIVLCYAMPMTMKAGHICTGSGASVISGIVLPMFKHLMRRENRLRVVLHAGTASEIKEHFHMYGLGPAHVNAVFGDPAQHQIFVRDWIEERRRIEEERRDFFDATNLL